MSQEQATNEGTQEETAESGWDLIKMYAANAKAQMAGNGEFRTIEGFQVSVDKFDGRPVIKVILASIPGWSDEGSPTTNLTMVFNTTDDGYKFSERVFCLTIEKSAPDDGRRYLGVDIAVSGKISVRANDLGLIWKAVADVMGHDLIVEGLGSGLRQALSGTRYEPMMFGPGQEA